VLVSEEDFFGALPHLIWHEDEPIVWPSSVSLYFVAKLARERVTVVLTGEGADETLAGYTRYAFTLKNAAMDALIAAWCRAFLRRGLRNTVATSSLLGADGAPKTGTYVSRQGWNSWASFYFDNFFSAFGEAEQRGLLTDAFALEAGQPAYRMSWINWNHSSAKMLAAVAFTDIKTTWSNCS